MIHLVSAKPGSVLLFERQPDPEVVVYVAGIGIGLRKGSVHELGEIQETYHHQSSSVDVVLPLLLLCLVLQAVLVLLTGQRYIVLP